MSARSADRASARRSHRSWRRRRGPRRRGRCPSPHHARSGPPGRQAARSPRACRPDAVLLVRTGERASAQSPPRAITSVAPRATASSAASLHAAGRFARPLPEHDRPRGRSRGRPGQTRSRAAGPPARPRRPAAASRSRPGRRARRRLRRAARPGRADHEPGEVRQALPSGGRTDERVVRLSDARRRRRHGAGGRGGGRDDAPAGRRRPRSSGPWSSDRAAHLDVDRSDDADVKALRPSCPLPRGRRRRRSAGRAAPQPAASTPAARATASSHRTRNRTGRALRPAPSRIQHLRCYLTVVGMPLTLPALRSLNWAATAVLIEAGTRGLHLP